MKKILIADDNSVSRELFVDALESDDYVVIAASDGADALAKAQEHQPDLILLDIQMPRLSGYDVLNLLRESVRFSGVKIAALTALAMAGDRERALAAGFSAYFTKPVRVNEFRDAVRRLLFE